VAGLGFAAVAAEGEASADATCPSGSGACSADDDASLAQIKVRPLPPRSSQPPSVGLAQSSTAGPADFVPCTYSKTYAFPASIVQQDSEGIEGMESRCKGNSVVNSEDEATCILDNNAFGFDYKYWPVENVCMYSEGATPNLSQDQCKTLYGKWIENGVKTVKLPDGTEAMTGIGYGALNGLRGECALLKYEGKQAVIFQVSVRYWSLCMTQNTWEYLLDGEDPKDHCFVPEVKMINCTDVPGMS